MSDRLSETNEAKGVVARGGGYGPFNSPQAINTGLAVLLNPALGGATFLDANGDGQTFAGDTTKLYRLVSNLFDDASKVGGYSLAAEERWVFEQFGQFVVAVAPGEAPQVFQMGVSTDFANLAGSPPQFTSIWRHGDFLMGGLNFTLTWSAFNNITDWTPSIATQSDSQVLDQAGGQIMGGTIGEYGAIFQETQIRRVTYVGPPVIFNFEQDAIEKRRGALSRYAFVRLGRLIFYASSQGFYVFDGQQSIPIGENKVDEYFKTRLNFGRRDLVTAAYDSAQKAVVFGFPTESANTITEQLIYSLTDRRWTHDDNVLEFLFETVGASYTVDNISNFFGPPDNIDVITSISIDSAAFRGGQKAMAGFNTSHALCQFDGQTRPATIDTIEAELVPGRRSLVTELWPLVDASPSSAVSARVLYRVLPGDPILLAPSSVMNAYGNCDALTDSRFMRARLELAAGTAWTRAEGIGFVGKPTSAR
jgi:hypothetical protein